MKATNFRHSGSPATQRWDDVTSAISKDYVASPESTGPQRFTTWLTTSNSDRSPHVTAVGAVWLDNTFWFQTGDTTRKAKNLVEDPRCVMSLSIKDCDFVLEGTAAKVDDPSEVKRIVAEWNKGGWPCEVDESGIGITAPFNAPGVGPAPWFVYRMTPTGATSVMTTSEDAAATRWTAD